MADRRIGAGPLLSVVGAVLTAASLWLHWYRVDLTDQFRDAFGAQAGSMGAFGSAIGEAFAKGLGKALDGLLPPSIVGTGWQVMNSLDVLILLSTALVAVTVLAGRALQVEGDQAAGVARILGVALGAVVVYKMFDRTGPHEFVKLAAGPWVALAGCVLMAVGGVIGPPKTELAPMPFVPAMSSAVGQSSAPAQTASIPPPGA